jgi:hypothetical protein
MFDILKTGAATTPKFLITHYSIIFAMNGLEKSIFPRTTMKIKHKITRTGYHHNHAVTSTASDFNYPPEKFEE